MKQDKKIVAAVNYEQVLQQEIFRAVQGDSGFYVAIVELINNSIDAGATKVRLKYGSFNEQNALFVHDDGKGFNHKGVNSMMSFAYSSKGRNDNTTIGVNGTGSKHLLGLVRKEENIINTQITVLTVNKEDYPEGLKMNIDFQYLVDISTQSINPESKISKMTHLKKWSKDIKRETGATVILTGYDMSRVKKSSKMIEELSKYLTPRALQMVEIYDEVESTWCKCNPRIFSGELFTFEHQTDALGFIEFQLYCGATKGEGVDLCGPINAIISLDEVRKRLTSSQKLKIDNKTWKFVVGYIYVENLNAFRQHDNSLRQDFYEEIISGELVQALELVGEELKEIIKLESNNKAFKQTKDIFQVIIQASKQKFAGTESADAGDLFSNRNISSNEEYFLLPQKLDLYMGQEKIITLHNAGKASIEYVVLKWNSDICNLEEKGRHSATVTPLKEGKGTITITCKEFKHTIQVEVHPVIEKVYINGPSAIKPNGIYDYVLKNVDPLININWAILIEKQLDIHVIPNMNDSSKVQIKVGPGAVGTFDLQASTKRKKVLARKSIVVSQEGVRNKRNAITIGKKHYILEAGNHFNDVIACRDTMFNDTNYDMIVVNPLHTILNGLKMYQSTPIILGAIVRAAVLDQLSSGLITEFEANTLSDAFLLKMNGVVSESFGLSGKAKPSEELKK